MDAPGFALSAPKPSKDLQARPPRNHLIAFFNDDRARERVRSFTDKAFGLHFVIDPTTLTKLRIRMSERKPVDTLEEQSLNQRSRDFHAAAKLISEFSDGIQAFTGLVSAVVSLPHRILLLDEPEAFLH